MNRQERRRHKSRARVVRPGVLLPDEDVIAALAAVDTAIVDTFIDRFDTLVRDPIGDLIGWLEPAALLQLLQPVARSQWTKFLQDLRCPARGLTVAAAERALASIRSRNQPAQYLNWLVTPIARSTMLLTGVSLPEATRQFAAMQHSGSDNVLDFDEAFDKYGPATMGLTMCLPAQHPGRAARLAYLLADGRGVPDSWPVADGALVASRDALIAALDDVFREMLDGFGPDPDELADAALADDDDAVTNDDDPTAAPATGADNADAGVADEVRCDDPGVTWESPAGDATDPLFAAGLRLVLGAVDPAAARRLAAGAREKAAASGSSALAAEADLWDALARVGELGDTMPDLAVAAASHRPDQPVIDGIADNETTAWATAIASPHGPALIAALRDVLAARGSGDNGAFVVALGALSTHPAAATLSATITAAVSGTLSISEATSINRTITIVRDHLVVSDTSDPGDEDTTAEIDEDIVVEDAEAVENARVVDETHEPDVESVAVANPDDAVDDVRADTDDEPAASEPETPDQPEPDTETSAAVTAPIVAFPPPATAPAGAFAPAASAPPTATRAPAGTVPTVSNGLSSSEVDNIDAGPLAINGDEGSMDAVRRILIGAGAWSALIELDGRRGDQTVSWRAAAIAEHLRSPYSPMVEEFGVIAGHSDTRTVRDAEAQLVGIAAAIRVAFICPTAGAGFAAATLASVHTARPGIAALAAAAQRADEMGLSYATESVDVAASAAEWEAMMDTIAADAHEIINRNGRTTFARGSWMWESWVLAGGELEQLLSPILLRNLAAADDVRSLRRTLSTDKGVRELINASDVKHRSGPNRHRIDGNARRTLQRWIAEAVEVAGRWLVGADANRASVTSQSDRRAEQLRTAFVEAWPRAEAELTALAHGDDAALAAAASAAQALLGPTVALVRFAVPLSDSEPSLAFALRGGLLRTTCPLDDELKITDEIVRVDALETAATTTWVEAFERRVANKQFHLADEIAGHLQRTGDPDAAQFLERARVDGEAAAAEMLIEISALETLLSQAQRFGRVSADAAEGLNADLDRTRQHRRDLDQVAREVDLIAEQLKREAIAAKDRLAELFAEQHGTNEYALVAERIERIMSSELPDLAAAEDLFQRALDGEDVAARITNVGRLFDAVTMHALAGGITPEIVEACAQRSSTPLDFSALDANAVRVGVEALTAWMRVANEERLPAWRDALVPVMRLLGMSGGTEARRKPSDSDHHRFDLTGVTLQGKALIPDFGSLAHGKYAFVLAWNHPSIDTLLNWVGQDPREAQATIVFYFGTLSADQRCQLVNKLRKGNQRPLVVVDDAVVAHLASVGSGTFEWFMRATLPYASVNPFYIGSGDVPVEMFYGRIQERHDVMETPDRTLIFGGRRLGKSALLRSAKTRFEEGDESRKAVLVDLYIAGIGQHRRPVAVWEELLPALVTAGIAPANDRRRRDDPEKAAPRAIREWLDADIERRLLVLLDEADDFFDADAETGFTQTAQFRELKDTYKGRFKVVFAGLHQVARFKHHHNQPFAQFVVDEAPIGPLPAGPAHDLLTRPLEALGWYFESSDLPARALHQCNYIPILIQELGQALVKHLSTRELAPGASRTPITTEDLEAVLSRTQSRARERIDVTLELDHRYKVIAWGVALGDSFTIDGRTTTDALYDTCRQWWPDGFARTNFTEFRSLVDELVHLGILAARTDATGAKSWALRSRNMQNLLGTTEQIQSNLEHLVSDNPPVGSFFGASTRRALDSTDGRHALSPLTEGQLTDIVGIGSNQIRIVVGTRATGVRAVADAIESVNRNLNERCQVVPVKDLKALKKALAVDPERHQLVVDDLAANEVGRDSLRQTMQHVLQKTATAKTATRSVVMIMDAVQYLDIADLLARTAPPGVDVNVVSCERFDADGLRAYMLADQEGFASSSDRSNVMQVTSGWPYLIDKLVAEARNSTFATARSRLIERLATPDGSDEFLTAVGLDDEILRTTFGLILDLVDGPATAAPAYELVDVVTGTRAEIDALRLAGALAETAAGDLYPEPLLGKSYSYSNDASD